MRGRAGEMKRERARERESGVRELRQVNKNQFKVDRQLKI